MTDKNKEKEGYYFKIIPKEEFPKFIERLKSALEKVDNKKGDKKYFELEIRGTKEEINGSKLEIFTFDESKYGEFIDGEKDYIKNALYCISLNFIEKEESGIEIIKKLFDQYKPLLEGIPVLKDKIKIFLRNEGKQVNFDITVIEGNLIKALIDLGLDFTQYHKFNFKFSTGIKVSEFFNECEDPVLYFIKVLSIIFSIQSETKNCRYLLIALSEALKDVKINDKKIQKQFDKFINFLRFLNAFNGNKIKVEYDAKILAGEGTKEAEEIEKLKSKVRETQLMTIGIVKNYIVYFISCLGLKDEVKATDLDKISISLSVPKYKNGLALSLKMPGLSKVLDEMLDN